jgi:hypothetical protein
MPQEHPVIAGINRVAASLAVFLGPLFWTILILLFGWAAISTH